MILTFCGWQRGRERVSDRTVVHVQVEKMEGKNKELRVAPQRNTHHTIVNIGRGLRQNILIRV